MKFHKQPSERL